MKIKVSNVIDVQDPTPELQSWCKEHLILDNPDYHKKIKMGYSVYNTPKKIYLYEVRGNIYRLPFGCIDILWKTYGRDIDFENDIEPIQTFNYQSGINPYDYQEEAIRSVLTAKNGILVAPCGSGKSNMGLEIIARLKAKALWLTHTQDLLNQSKERAKSVFGCAINAFGTITAGKVNISEGITFATVQTMAKLDLPQYKDEWSVVIVDECMPANTLIDTPNGKKELKNLRTDDIISSYNRLTGEIENKRVLHFFKNPAHNIVKIKLTNGEVITCTSNHPIFTERGWIDAERLGNNDYVMRLVWQGSRHGHNAKYHKTTSIKKRLLLLLKRMFHKGCSQKEYLDRRTQTKSFRNNESNKQEISRAVCGANENKQSNERLENKRKSFKKIERNRSSSQNQMWKWNRINSSTAKSDDCTSKTDGSICRISDTNENAERFRLSTLLQGGYSNTRKNDCNRGRWKFSLCNQQARTRQEKGYVFEQVRVDCVEVQEQTSDGTFGGLCSDGYVYNIEVEDNNNYFADGYLVHNCQHCAGSATKVTQFYKVITNLSARYKIGLTATPHRADGLTRSMFALLGNTIHEVSREAVANTTCPVIVEMIPTEYMPEDIRDISKPDGTLDYAKLINNLISDDARFLRISHEINSREGAMIVLANRVEYLERLSKAYEGKSVCLSGMSATKNNKLIRKKALADLQSGELDCVFATYSLAAEGLDCPGLKYVVFATPEKDERIVSQAVGRVARKYDDKEYGTVLDFVDNYGIYKGYWKKRKKIYWEVGCDILE